MDITFVSHFWTTEVHSAGYKTGYQGVRKEDVGGIAALQSAAEGRGRATGEEGTSKCFELYQEFHDWLRTGRQRNTESAAGGFWAGGRR